MSNKEFLIKVLERIWESRELGQAILVLLQEGELEWEAIDKITKVMVDSLDSVESKWTKARIMKWIQLIKEREKAENERNEEAIKEMEDLIDSI
jgi:hypothetical protein